MKQTATEFFKEHLSDAGGISWPDSIKGRTELARTLFGIGIVEANDYWIARAEEILDVNGQNFPPAFKQERSIRQTLASLTSEQRSSVLQLVSIAVHGALFSSLTSFDQFPRADLTMSVEDPDLGISVPLAPTDVDLHDSFFDWMAQFSSHDSAA